MADNRLANRVDARGAVRARLRTDLQRCVTRSESLGLTAIAIYLQRALDELGMMDV